MFRHRFFLSGPRNIYDQLRKDPPTNDVDPLIKIADDILGLRLKDYTELRRHVNELIAENELRDTPALIPRGRSYFPHPLGLFNTFP